MEGRAVAAPPHAMEESDTHNRCLSYIRTDAQFMLSGRLGNVGGPLAKLGNPSWRPGTWMHSLAVAGGSILLFGVIDPLGDINTPFPLFAAFGSAEILHRLGDVIRNTFIQDTLSVALAAVVAILLVSAIILVCKEIRSDRRWLTEDDPAPSRTFAPSGMISTAGEREVQRQWHALTLAPMGHSGSAVSPTQSPGTGAP
jgi:hypothetical protein